MNSKKSFLFYNLLTEEEKQSLKIRTYEKEDCITCFESGYKFYYILDGNVKFIKNLEKLELTSMSGLSKGYLIGSLVFLTGDKFCFDVIAATNIVKVLEINPEIIKRLKNSSLEFNNYLLEIIIKCVMDTVETLRINFFCGVKGLIAYHLIRNSKNGYVYTKKYDEVIKMLNISQNGFYSTLNKLVQERLIEKSKNSIKILNSKKLEELYKDFLN